MQLVIPFSAVQLSKNYEMKTEICFLFTVIEDPI